MTLYEKYSVIRDIRGVKDFDVAKGCDIAPSTLSDWKKGRSMPKIDKIKRIAEFLGVPVTELI